MTEIQNKIVALLKDDARISPDRIAVLLGTEEKTVAGEISKLEKSGVIVKYTALINEEVANPHRVGALIEVKVSPVQAKGFDSIAEQIMEFPEVKSLYLMSGAYDLAVFIEGNSLREVASFVSEKLSVMAQVLSTATHFILKKYKTEGVVLKSEPGKRLSIQA